MRMNKIYGSICKIEPAEGKVDSLSLNPPYR